MKCCMCGFELEYNYCHLVDRGLVFCSIECLKENYDENYKGLLQIKTPNMSFSDAINKLKKGCKVRKVNWNENYYIYMDDNGYIRRKDGKKYFIKLNNDLWEEYK